jgi:hypothetical protein
MKVWITWVRGTGRVGERTEGEDLPDVFRSFAAVTSITRTAGGR